MLLYTAHRIAIRKALGLHGRMKTRCPHNNKRKASKPTVMPDAEAEVVPLAGQKRKRADHSEEVQAAQTEPPFIDSTSTLSNGLEYLPLRSEDEYYEDDCGFVDV